LVQTPIAVVLQHSCCAPSPTSHILTDLWGGNTEQKSEEKEREEKGQDLGLHEAEDLPRDLVLSRGAHSAAHGEVHICGAEVRIC